MRMRSCNDPLASALKYPHPRARSTPGPNTGLLYTQDIDARALGILAAKYAVSVRDLDELDESIHIDLVAMTVPLKRLSRHGHHALPTRLRPLQHL
ncbi:hypothetical protein NUW54_g1507 [Trametes sanguinea]|uniref:Uncharacterized protein n=1 Tax=Trametes sanguinea TaxID=158606 RepID=A0ACC1Q655_9APHY|nr:hypothetical protein NUW54_g1507 [Trametes sanguinea]